MRELPARIFGVMLVSLVFAACAVGGDGTDLGGTGTPVDAGSATDAGHTTGNDGGHTQPPPDGGSTTPDTGTADDVSQPPFDSGNLPDTSGGTPDSSTSTGGGACDPTNGKEAAEYLFLKGAGLGTPCSGSTGCLATDCCYVSLCVLL